MTTYCAVCSMPQFDSDAGITCQNGHGGADSLATPDPSDQRIKYRAQYLFQDNKPVGPLAYVTQLGRVVAIVTAETLHNNEADSRADALIKAHEIASALNGRDTTIAVLEKVANWLAQAGVKSDAEMAMRFGEMEGLIFSALHDLKGV